MVAPVLEIVGTYKGNPALTTNIQVLPGTLAHEQGHFRFELPDEYANTEKHFPLMHSTKMRLENSAPRTHQGIWDVEFSADGCDYVGFFRVEGTEKIS